jgi:hypothetical protein
MSLVSASMSGRAAEVVSSEWYAVNKGVVSIKTVRQGSTVLRHSSSEAVVIQTSLPLRVNLI